MLTFEYKQERVSLGRQPAPLKDEPISQHPLWQPSQCCILRWSSGQETNRASLLCVCVRVCVCLLGLIMDGSACVTAPA